MDEELPLELEAAITRETPFEQLATHLRKQVGNSREQFVQVVVRYSLRRQLRWSTSLIKTLITDERTYYMDLLRFSKSKLMLFPYHLSDVIVKKLCVTAFKYYLEMMEDVMQSDRSYDSLPNFTAADCALGSHSRAHFLHPGVRLLGIGRNQFIDIMNKSRTKGWLAWGSKTSVALKKGTLPTGSVPIEMEHWWNVLVGYVTDEDIKHCSAAERKVIDDLKIRRGARLAGELDRDIVQSLYHRGLIYLDVPIASDDLISVPPLEGFVMNRVTGDYFETLLYKVFVSLDERTTIQQLATLLQLPLESVKCAVSVYCRLGFARKKNPPPLRPSSDSPTWHASWLTPALAAKPPPLAVPMPSLGSFSGSPAQHDLLLQDEIMAREEAGEVGAYDELHSSMTQGTKPSGEFRDPQNSAKRVGLLFDSTLTAFLMMGELGLKSHAVTMFEVGKLSDESLDEFVAQLDTHEGTHAEGEAQRYYDHALGLRAAIRFLRRNPKTVLEGHDGGLDLLRCDSLQGLEPATRLRILQKNYGVLITMAPLAVETPSVTAALPHHFGPPIPEVNSPWFPLYVAQACSAGPASFLYPKGTRVSTIPAPLASLKAVLLSTWTADPVLVQVTHLLPTVNDALLTSPVLLQAYGSEKDTKVVVLPFPIKLVNSEPPQSYDAKNLHLHPTVQRLASALYLSHSIGYIRMLYDEHLKDWVPLEVKFGMPLFDPVLTTNVCSLMESEGLLTPAGLTKHSEHCRELALRLLCFIADQVKSTIELGIDGAPYPCKAITFPPTAAPPHSK